MGNTVIHFPRPSLFQRDIQRNCLSFATISSSAEAYRKIDSATGRWQNKLSEIYNKIFISLKFVIYIQLIAI